jgi:hypothetical protein
LVAHQARITEKCCGYSIVLWDSPEASPK